ncbi:MAG TPA: glycosyl hydrolase family 28-related protein, partial [Spirochaetota bacterium]|nr:glycosyl hydrolase family 28-related protein [Spirochaetota bacterium]
MLDCFQLQAVSSDLYPSNWYPGYTDGSGRFLHDFSYAGYHCGEMPLPENPPGSIYNVTQAPYNADNSGTADATAAIQAAIDDAAAAAGGIVYLPAGTYNISPGAGSYSDYALLINDNGIVLKGDGVNQTFVYNTATNIRYKEIIRIG